MWEKILFCLYCCRLFSSLIQLMNTWCNTLWIMKTKSSRMYLRRVWNLGKTLKTRNSRSRSRSSQNGGRVLFQPRMLTMWRYPTGWLTHLVWLWHPSMDGVQTWRGSCSLRLYPILLSRHICVERGCSRSTRGTQLLRDSRRGWWRTLRYSLKFPPHFLHISFPPDFHQSCVKLPTFSSERVTNLFTEKYLPTWSEHIRILDLEPYYLPFLI